MTVAEWLESRTPPAPAALSQRLLLALGRASERDAVETPEVCLAAAEAKDSRLWAGIHFPIDNEVGAALGRQVGRRVAEVAGADAAR